MDAHPPCVLVQTFMFVCVCIHLYNVHSYFECSCIFQFAQCRQAVGALLGFSPIDAKPDVLQSHRCAELQRPIVCLLLCLRATFKVRAVLKRGNNLCNGFLLALRLELDVYLYFYLYEEHIEYRPCEVRTS